VVNLKRLCVLFVTVLFVISTWAIAEEVELLDAYLEGLPSSSSSQNIDSGVFLSLPVDVAQTHKVVRPQAVKYRTIEIADSSELYQEMSVQSAASNQTGSNVEIDVQKVRVVPEGDISSDVVISNKAEDQSREDLEVIELEPTQEEFVVIEAPEAQRAVTTNTTTISGRNFCQQRPYARECLLSKYLSLCKKDPQSTDCKSQLEKFDNFCGSFPNAYKCKKAKVAATCEKNPSSSACKAFTQHY
jgi:hypothetical protein